MKKLKDVNVALQKTELRELLQKKVDGQLTEQEHNKFWAALEVAFTPHAHSVLEGTEPVADHVEFFETILFLVEDGISEPEPYISTQLVHIVMELRHFLFNENIPDTVQQQTAKVLALWCKRSVVCVHDLCIPTFRYFLLASLNKKIASNVKYLWSLHTSFQNLDSQDDTFKSLVPLMLKMVDSEFFLNIKEGQNLVAFIMCQYPALIEIFHNRIKTVLLFCSKKHASNIGDIYSRALNNSDPRSTKVIEEVCLKDLVSCILQSSRHGLCMGKRGQQLMHVLRSMHNNRRHTSICMALVSVYEPVLWRFVSSCNNIHRCNAAEVLLNLYPLQYPGGQSMRNRLLLKKQHEAISKLLLDNCHIVRIIVIRASEPQRYERHMATGWDYKLNRHNVVACCVIKHYHGEALAHPDTCSSELCDVCRILCEFWPSIPTKWRHQWMQLLIQDLSVDGSSMAVRCSVYRYLSELLKNENAANHLATMLPALYQQIHDTNLNVRKTFVGLLKEIKNSGLLPFSRIVPPEHLIARLGVEDKRVAKELVSLIFNNILVPKQSVDERVKRVKKLAGCNLNVMRNFFNYSEHELHKADALNLVENILVHIGDSLFKNKENVRTMNPEVSLEPQVLRGLLDTISILWLMHAKDAMKGSLDRLHKLIRVCFPPLFVIYKNGDRGVLSSLLFLGSLMPIHILRKVSLAPGVCMSELKNMQLDASIQENCLMWVSPLCSWGRAADVLGVVMEWLNEAFRTQNLNTTVTSPQPRQRRVHFQREDSKPLVALHVLDAVFTHQPNRSAVLSKNRDLVYDLWVYLERTKRAIEMRLEATLESPMLTDHFLGLCLLRYAKLIVLLGKVEDKNPNPFDSHQQFLNLLLWAHRVLFPHIPECMPTEIDERPLVATLLQDLISVTDAMIAVGEADDHFVHEAVEFAKLLLDTGCALMFVHSVSCLLHRIVGHCELYYRCIERRKDEQEKKVLFETKVPTIVFSVLVAFKKENYTQAVVTKYIKNIGAVRAALHEVLQLALQFCGSKSRMVCGIMTDCVDAVVGIMMNDLDEDETREPARNLHNLPYLAAQLVCVFRQDEVLSVLFVCMFARRIRLQYSEDILQLVSAIHVLHVLVYDPGTMCTRDLQTAAQSGAEALKKHKSVRDVMLTSANSMMSSIQEKLRV